MRPAGPGIAVAASVALGISAQAGWLIPPPRTSTENTLPAAVGTPDLLCPGAETLVAADGGKAEPTGGATVTSVVAAPADDQVGEIADVAPLAAEEDDGIPLQAAAGRAAVLIPTSRRAGALRVRSGPDAPAIVAAQSTVARNGDLRGLTGTTCGAASDDVWLVGGGTQSGRRLRLVLTNPGPAVAVADIAVHGAQGPVETPSGDGVVVPAGKQVAVLVDALAPDQRQIALHVTTRSGRVRATLHDHELSGLIATGADDVPAAGRPARRQIVPGIVYDPVKPGPASSVTALGGKVAGALGRPGGSAIRVAAPGNQAALVRIRLIGADGVEDVPGGGVLEVPAGGVADLPLYGSQPGVYAAVVDADVPVLASALVGRSVPGSALVNTSQRNSPLVRPAEFAWTTATMPLAGAGGGAGTWALPPAPSSTRLTFTTLGGTEKVVVIAVAKNGTLGPRRVVTVPKASTVATQLPGGTVGVVLETQEKTSGVVAAAVSTVQDRGGELVTIQPLVPAQRRAAAPVVRHEATLGLESAEG